LVVYSVEVAHTLYPIQLSPNACTVGIVQSCLICLQLQVEKFKT
jgi:hypothetical protein